MRRTRSSRLTGTARAAEAERIASPFAGAIELAVARPCRILGPGDRENLLFFKLMRAGVRLSIGGRPRPLSLVDVEDVVALLVLLATRPEASGQVFFARGEETTLEELQEGVARALGRRTRQVRIGPASLRCWESLPMGRIICWTSTFP